MKILSVIALLMLVVPAALAATEAQIKTGATLDNLQAAFNGESNAHARYLAFAKKADQEGYGKVASLFRAAARAEEIHARNHAEVIKKLGGTPNATIETPVVKTTKENLEAAIKGETYERDVMYPAFLKVARADRNKDAIQTLNYAKTAEAEHAKLYTEALNNLAQMKGPGQEYYVCTVCGYTVTKLDFAKCPSCFTPKHKYDKVG
jgi:rubrerythrin